MTSVTAILNELAKTLGHEAVRTACLQFAGKKPSATAAAAPAAPPQKEKKPRGPNGWTKFVTSVLEELQAEAPEGTKVIRKEAMRVAGERWAEQKGPEALKAYRERQAKKAAAGGGAAASDSEAEAEELEEGEVPPAPPAPAKKPRGRPPKTKEAVPAPAPAPSHSRSAKQSGAESKAAELPCEHTEEEQEAFRFLFRLQESGRTNMFGAPAYLVRELGTDPTEAERLTREYMGNYDALSKLYSVEAQKA